MYLNCYRRNWIKSGMGFWMRTLIVFNIVSVFHQLQLFPPYRPLHWLLFTQQTQVRPSEAGNPAAFDYNEEIKDQWWENEVLTVESPPQRAYDWQQLLQRTLTSAFESEHVALRDQRPILSRIRKILPSVHSIDRSGESGGTGANWTGIL